MGTIGYYLSLPFIYLISFSPDWLLYTISDFLYLALYSVFGYRKKIVRTNLKKSFPEKSDEEITHIEKKYYKYLCDLIVESLKTITMSENYVRKHLKLHGQDLLTEMYQRKQNFIIVMGHFGNWEMAGPCFSLNTGYELNVVYKPLANTHFEKLFSKTRTKFNTKIIPMDSTLRGMVANRKIINATALIADQTPIDLKTAYWLDFLNQDTMVFKGVEKLAKMFDYPVVYMHVDRVKRGYYEITPTVLFDQPKETEEHEITIGFYKKLEEEIRKKPDTWLWSHRRWKRQRKVTTNGAK